MAVKIVYEGEFKFKFSDLEVGAVYLDEQSQLWMKTEEIQAPEYDEPTINCVNLKDGGYGIAMSDEAVKPVNITITVEE